MQKKRFIPTPLSEAGHKPRLQIDAAPPVSRFRALQMLLILGSLLWRRLAIRIWPPLGKVGARYGTLENARFLRSSCEKMGASG